MNLGVASKSPRRLSRVGLWRYVWALCWGVVAQTVHAQVPSEADYFADVPEVLTVTRLSQSLSDTPGAVTVIDRDTIRRLGARDLVDVLRLVPGYLVSGYNGANQVGAYHAPVDEYGTRNLILVDGRSIYSSTYLGGTMRSVAGIVMEDVERIEVFRGSNSAAYGANALFGVINIITRHAVDAVGGTASVRLGDGALQDLYAGWAGGDADFSQSWSVSQRRDDGYVGIADSRRLDNLNWRADWRPDASTEATLALGYSRLLADEGFSGGASNPLREISAQNMFGHARWQRDLGPADQVKFSLSWDQDRTGDLFAYQVGDPGLDGTLVDQGSVENRWQLEVQHQHVASERWRWVLGAGYHDVRVHAPALFATAADVRMWDARVFGHAEWRPAPAWVMNLGLFAGHHSDSGGYALPRLALNHHLNEAHTLRFSVGQSLRQLNLFELYGDRRFINPAGNQVATGYQAQPGLRPEKLQVVEVGYHGRWAQGRLTTDVRLFREAIRDFFEIDGTQAAPQPQGFDIRGLELQLDWTPWAGTSLRLSHICLDFGWGDPATVAPYPPRSLSSLAWWQQLGEGWDMVWLLSARDAMAWRSISSRIGSSTRVDVRLSKHWNWSGRRAEVALALQNLNGEQAVFVPDRFEPRRAVLQMRTEF